MTVEEKQANLEVLRKTYIDFMRQVTKLPGSFIQKQQSIFRFDEGHMWMQNAIASYSEPEPKHENSPESKDSEQSNVSA